MAKTSNNVIEQFSKEVIDFSSQYGLENGSSYVCINIAGPTTIYPKYGDFTTSSVFRTHGCWWKHCPSAMEPVGNSLPNYTSEDYIDLKLENRVIIQRIDLYETYNPGALVRIYAAYPDPTFHGFNVQRLVWVTLWKASSENRFGAPAKSLPPATRIMTPELQTIPNRATDLIRLEFNSSARGYYTELDAVKVFGYKPDVDSIQKKNNLPKGEMEAVSAKIHDSFNFLKLDDEDSKWKKDTYPTLPSAPPCLPIENTKVSDNGYFDKLPTELMLEILSYLNIVELAQVARLSRRFLAHYNQILATMTQLNLRAFWSRLSDNTLGVLRARCSSGRLARLDISWAGNYGQITSVGFAGFLHVCGSNLTTLVLASCRFVDDDCVLHVANYCQNLKELDLSSCRSIETEGCRPIARLIRLNRLVLYRSKIDVLTLCSIISSCQHLMHLGLGSCTEIDNFDKVANYLGDFCKNLISVDLWRARSLTAVGLHHLASNCSQLEELDLGWCSELNSSSRCFTELVKYCPKLKKLFLTANRSVNNSDLEAVSQYLPDLEQLDVLGTRDILPEAVLKLLQSCPRLCMLDLSFCAEISHAYVLWLKEQFPNCAILMSYQDQLTHRSGPSVGRGVNHNVMNREPQQLPN